MQNVRRKFTIYAPFGLAALLVAMSVYCFMSANKATEQLWEKAWDEPSAMLLLMGKTDAETIALAPSELVNINNNRLRNIIVGRALIILGVILLLTGLIRLIWRRGTKPSIFMRNKESC